MGGYLHYSFTIDPNGWWFVDHKLRCLQRLHCPWFMPYSPLKLQARPRNVLCLLPPVCNSVQEQILPFKVQKAEITLSTTFGGHTLLLLLVGLYRNRTSCETE